VRAQCSCSRHAVAAMLANFSAEDRAGMVENGQVVVTCEFCSSVYAFTPAEAGAGVDDADTAPGDEGKTS